MSKDVNKVGRYKLLQRLGHGGMGITYLAKVEGAQGWNRNYALKQMLPEMARFLDYFSSEAFIGGKLNHANIVAVVDYFVDEDGRHNIVMEYIEGANVAEIIHAKDRLSPAVAVYIARAALRGLAHVHNAYLGPNIVGPLVHRDLSPDNIFVSNGADVKVGDFGIAKANGLFRQETSTDGFRGKLAYASPEQLLNLLLDGRADVYQIGLCLYEMLSGRRTFSGGSSIYDNTRTVAQIMEGNFTPLVELVPTLKPELAAAVATLMQRDRDQRLHAEDARALLKKACPECDDAEAELSAIVRQMSKRTRRATSAWNVPAELATPPAPPQGGVILTALPDMETAKISPADQLATIVKQDQTVGAKASAIAPVVAPLPPSPPNRDRSPGDGVPVGEIHDKYSPIDYPEEPSQPTTELIDPPSRLLRFARRPATLLVFSLALLAVVGAIVVYKAVYASSRRAAKIAPAPIAEQRAMPNAQPVAPVAPPPAPKAEPPSMPPAPVPQSQEPGKEGKRERGAEHEHGSKHCPVDVPEGAGLIIVDKERDPISVIVDDVPVGMAPIPGYPVDPGKHLVTLERRRDAGDVNTSKTTVRVSAGRCYLVNKHPSIASIAPALPATTLPPPTAQKTYQQLFDEAQAAYVRNACSHAQELARQAAKQAPDRKHRVDAYRILASASCCLRDSAGVAESWSYLDDSGRGFAKYVCGRYGTETPKP